jgi:RHS repeat-associated protein
VGDGHGRRGTALQVTLQYDGNLVLYVDDWAPVWDTATAGHPGAWLALADDALTLRDPEGTVLWTVPLGVPLLTKTTPAAGATVAGSALTFTWTAVAGESYRVCWDTSNNHACNTTWVDAGDATTLTVTGVAPGTYWWQVKTVTGGVEADHGAWRPLTVVAAPSFGKQAPATGTTGLGNDVTLQWTAVPDEGYWVCWDTVDNTTCDTMWWPNGGATAKLLSNLAPATYYWQVKTAGSGLKADGGTWWSFTVTTPLVPADHWKAEYFGNTTVSGTPVATVDEGTGYVDHSWGHGGPAGLADHFSARFTRTVTLAAGTYWFTVTTDDGSRLWVDNQLTVDAWWPQPPTGYTTEIDLEAGNHTLRYEYFEQTGGATAQLSWAFAPEPAASAVALPPGPTPPARLGAAGTAAAVLSLLAALWAIAGLASRVVKRRWCGLAGRARVIFPGDSGQAASPPSPVRLRRVNRLPQAASRAARVPATALLLTAMLLVPAAALAQIPTQEVEYYHTDALGSVRAVTKQVNGTWQVVARHDYMPFGEEVAPPSPPQDKRLFTGRERDSETGLDYFEARYLMASAARFTTPDEFNGGRIGLVPPAPLAFNPLPYADITNPQSLNKYAYCMNNPLAWVDPDGHQQQKPSPMAISEAGVKFIAEYEAFSATVYPDAVRNDTIGYGHRVLPGEKFNEPISEAGALQIMARDLQTFVSGVNAALAVTVTQSQFDALVSLSYNIGVAGFTGSTVAKMINGKGTVTEEMFTAWNKIGKPLEVCDGLTMRRKDEFEVFNGGDYQRGPAQPVRKEGQQ